MKSSYRIFLILSILIMAAAMSFVSCGDESEAVETTAESESTAPTPTKTFVDSNGNIIAKESYYPDGSVRTREEYDENGNVTSSVIHNEDGTVNAEEKIEYGEDGKLKNYKIKTNYYENGVLVEYNVSNFDHRQWQIDSRNYSADGTPIGFIQYEYDEKGNLVLEKEYNEKMYLSFTYKYTYDEKNLLVEKKITDTLDDFVSLTRYEWTDDKKILKETNYNKNGDIINYSDYVYKEGEIEPERHVYISDGAGGFFKED